MVLCRSALIAVLAAFAPVAYGAGGQFCYDESKDCGPSHWKDLHTEPAANQCGGSKNSPIAVETSSCDMKADYKFQDGTCTLADVNYTITTLSALLTFPSDGSCTLNSFEIPVDGIDGTYEALQFHIHTSSEHTIDGKFFGAELHIVHKEKDGDRYAVVGLMIEVGATTLEIFDCFLDGWTEAAADCVDCEVFPISQCGDMNNFNVYDLVPNGSSFYFYDGGLTTPPCSEVVWWNLADIPIQISVAQYNRLINLILGYRDDDCELATVASPEGSTSRPTQPLFGRTVKRICPKKKESKKKKDSKRRLGDSGINTP